MRIYSIEDRQASFISAFASSARNHNFDLHLLNPSKTTSSAFEKFLSVYQHFSINPPQFEIACFRRYFDIASLVSENERFIISDSDILINLDRTRLPQYFTEDEGSLVGSIGVKNGNLEQDISPHFSSWNAKLLNEFIDYVIHQYQFNTDKIEKIFIKRKSDENKRSAISDMTLLHMFVKDTNVKFINSNHISNNIIVDHNFSMKDACNAHFKMEYGYKAVRLNKGKLSFITSNDIQIHPAIIHLQGRAKIAAQSLSKRHLTSARIKLSAVNLAKKVREVMT